MRARTEEQKKKHRDRQRARTRLDPEKNRAHVSAWREANPEKYREGQRRYYQQNKGKINQRTRKRPPEKTRQYAVKARYGLTVSELSVMLTSQDNACAICSVVFTGTPCVDHDHDTKVVRGLLCRMCNTRLGGVGDSIEGVLEFCRRAVNYLKNGRQA